MVLIKIQFDNGLSESAAKLLTCLDVALQALVLPALFIVRAATAILALLHSCVLNVKTACCRNTPKLKLKVQQHKVLCHSRMYDLNNSIPGVTTGKRIQKIIKQREAGSSWKDILLNSEHTFIFFKSK